MGDRGNLRAPMLSHGLGERGTSALAIRPPTIRAWVLRSDAFYFGVPGANERRSTISLAMDPISSSGLLSVRDPEMPLFMQILSSLIQLQTHAARTGGFRPSRKFLTKLHPSADPVTP